MALALMDRARDFVRGNPGISSTAATGAGFSAAIAAYISKASYRDFKLLVNALKHPNIQILGGIFGICVATVCVNIVGMKCLEWERDDAERRATERREMREMEERTRERNETPQTDSSGGVAIPDRSFLVPAMVLTTSIVSCGLACYGISNLMVTVSRNNDDITFSGGTTGTGTTGTNANHTAPAKPLTPAAPERVHDVCEHALLAAQTLSSGTRFVAVHNDTADILTMSGAPTRYEKSFFYNRWDNGKTSCTVTIKPGECKLVYAKATGQFKNSPVVLLRNIYRGNSAKKVDPWSIINRFPTNTTVRASSDIFG